MATGITVRHHRKCQSLVGGNCGSPCTPTYQAWVWVKRDGRKKKQSFPSLAAAKAWRADATSAVNKGALRASTTQTLREAWDAWLDGATDGSIRNRSGDRFKPSVIRSYATSMRLRILEDLGAARLSEISLLDLQAIVKTMQADGLDASTIRNTFMPMRAIYRQPEIRQTVPVNPTAGLLLPAVRGTRDRIASPVEAAALIAALDDDDRAVWATALYAGLRLGELWALRDEDVDLEAGVIRVERSWDRREGVIDPKSRAGRRAVPIVAALRSHLAARKLRRRGSEGLFFGEGQQPFNRDTLVARANRAWKQAEAAPIGLHEARHTFASLAITAGVNVKALSTYMGHSSITITLDRYGHLMPGNEDEAVALFDKYLAGPQSGPQLAETASLSQR